METSSLSFSISESDIGKIIDEYKDYSISPNNDYIVFASSRNGLNVTIYVNKKKQYKVVFRGVNAAKEASRLGFNSFIPRPNRTCPPRSDTFFPEIGSDEVGFGDLFGPIIVAAAYIDSSLLNFISSLGVTDSKILNDSRILEIGPLLIKKVPYSELYLPLDKYNELQFNGLNMNKIKAKMHNRVLLNLEKKFPNANLKMDQFAPEPLYYSYLKEESEKAYPIEFSTKGELAFPSVATASVIARYAFLRRMQQLDKIYDTHFPFGASSKVDEFGREFVKKYGKDELKKIAKMNFANISRIV